LINRLHLLFEEIYFQWSFNRHVAQQVRIGKVIARNFTIDVSFPDLGAASIVKSNRFDGLIKSLLQALHIIGLFEEIEVNGPQLDTL
jgi:hypothetical protein